MDFSPAMWTSIVPTIKRHYTAGTLNFPMGTYITLVHIVALVGSTYVPLASAKTLLFSLVLWWISGLGITAGVHRLWSHRSYEANFIVRFFLMLANSVANQVSLKGERGTWVYGDEPEP